jgi:hypothetical protein
MIDPVGGDGSAKIAHDLADFDDDAPGWVGVEAAYLAVRVASALSRSRALKAS